jgi:predicted RNA binding protein YcfA (HicA-like mRNA interferase family)
MTGAEFVRHLRRLGRKQRLAVRTVPGSGKGSHGRIFYGARSTTIPDLRHELGPGLLRALCRQLGVEVKDLTRR